MRQGMGCTASPVCRIYLKGQHYVLWLREARADQMKRACRRQRQHSVKERAKPQNKKTRGWNRTTREEKSKNSKLACISTYSSCILLHCTQAKSSYNKEEGTEGALTLYFFEISQTVKELRKCLWLLKSVCIKKLNDGSLSKFTGCARSNHHFFFSGVSVRIWRCFGLSELFTPCWRDYRASQRHIPSFIYIINCCIQSEKNPPSCNKVKN